MCFFCTRKLFFQTFFIFYFFNKLHKAKFDNVTSYWQQYFFSSSPTCKPSVHFCYFRIWFQLLYLYRNIPASTVPFFTSLSKLCFRINIQIALFFTDFQLFCLLLYRIIGAISFVLSLIVELHGLFS